MEPLAATRSSTTRGPLLLQTTTMTFAGNLRRLMRGRRGFCLPQMMQPQMWIQAQEDLEVVKSAGGCLPHLPLLREAEEEDLVSTGLLRKLHGGRRLWLKKSRQGLVLAQQKKYIVLGGCNGGREEAARVSTGKFA